MQRTCFFHVASCIAKLCSTLWRHYKLLALGKKNVKTESRWMSCVIQYYSLSFHNQICRMSAVFIYKNVLCSYLDSPVPVNKIRTFNGHFQKKVSDSVNHRRYNLESIQNLETILMTRSEDKSCQFVYVLSVVHNYR